MGKTFDFDAPIEIAGGEYIYATSSAPSASFFDVYYSVSTNYANCPALIIGTVGYASFSNCELISNGASNTVEIISVSASHPYFKITNCHLETLDTVSQYSISASTALFDAPIYNNVLIGALSDVTPVADSGNIIV